MQFLIKLGISAFVIVAASELSKRNSLAGGLIASLPLVSVMALLWLYAETRDLQKVSSLSMSIFWMVLPSLSLFLILPLLLKRHVPFYWALPLTCVATSLIYYGATLLYARLGIKL